MDKSVTGGKKCRKSKRFFDGAPKQKEIASLPAEARLLRQMTSAAKSAQAG